MINSKSFPSSTDLPTPTTSRDVQRSIYQWSHLSLIEDDVDRPIVTDTLISSTPSFSAYCTVDLPASKYDDVWQTELQTSKTKYKPFHTSASRMMFLTSVLEIPRDSLKYIQSFGEGEFGEVQIEVYLKE